MTSWLAVLLAAATAQAEADGSWTLKANVPQATTSSVSASDGFHLYLLGGFGTQSTSRRYDPATDTWSTLAPPPASMYYNSGARVGDHIYAFGTTGSSAVYRYSISSNTWATLPAALPQTFGGGATSTVLGGKVYVVGGGNILVGTVHNREFDPATETFTMRAPLPSARTRHAAAASEALGRLWIFGGNGSSSTTYEYSPATDTWTTRAPYSLGGIAANSYGMAAAFFNGRAYLTGGYTSSTMQRTVNEYDPATDSWMRRTDMNLPRQQHAIGVVGSRIYVAGGGTGVASHAATATSTEEFIPPYQPPTVPIGASPSGVDLTVYGDGGGPVLFSWTASTDDGPAEGITYDVEVSGATDWSAPEASAYGIAATTVTLELAAGTAQPRTVVWRLRARDGEGHPSAWSPLMAFRVKLYDGEDHGAGDSAKVCGMSASGTGAAWALLLAIAVLARIIR